jgi:hypothetical protein
MKRFLVMSALMLQASFALGYSGDWINGSNGYTGPNPVYVGREGRKDVYVCRSGGSIVGKLVKADGKCYVGYYGKEIAYTSYQVLQDRIGRMRFFYSTSLTDPYLVFGGVEQPGNVQLHICRVRKGNDFIGGKMVGGTQNGKCYYGYYGKEYVATVFEALSDA